MEQKELRIVRERMAASPVSWVGPRLQFGMGEPLIFHRLIVQDPRGVATAIRNLLDETGTLRNILTIWRADAGVQEQASRRLLDAINVLVGRLRDELRIRLRASGLTRRQAEGIQQILLDLDSHKRMVYVVGCVLAAPLSSRERAIQPLPSGVSPSNMLAHPGVWTLAISGDRSSIGERLVREVAEGRIVLYPEVRLNPEEMPIYVGWTPLGAPVHIRLGAPGQAQHILIAGPTGRGKSVTAMRIVLAAKRQGVLPIILDTKGEMLRGKRGVFGLPVLDPADQNVRWPPWTLPFAHALFPAIRARIGMKNGRLVISRKGIQEALEQANPQLFTSVTMLAQLLSFVSAGKVQLHTSEFATRYVQRLAEGGPWLSASEPASMAEALAQEGTGVIRETIGEGAARWLLSQESPFRHLISGNAQGVGDLLRGEGAVIAFRTAAVLMGDKGNELLSALYSYVLSLIIATIITMRDAGGWNHRVLLYVEEAHRVQHMIESMLRLLRSFGVSVMLVTQSIEEVTSAALEQIRHFLLMGPSFSMLREVFERLGIGHDPTPFVPSEQYGSGVYLSLVSGRPSTPLLFRVDLSPDERSEILGVASSRGEI